jgi:hypothetical protein
MYPTQISCQIVAILYVLQTSSVDVVIYAFAIICPILVKYFVSSRALFFSIAIVIIFVFQIFQ